MTMVDTSNFFIVPPILGRLGIIFSETHIDLCAHTVANSPFNRVPKTGTKSVTIIGRSEIDGTVLVWILAQTQA